MGCSTSRLDDLPAVTLCRRRRKSIDAANKHFTSFANSHYAYMQSLNSLSQALVQTLPQFPPHSRSDQTKRVDDKDADHSGHIQFTPSSDDDCENEVNEDQRHGGLSVVYGSQNNAPPPPPPPESSSMTWDLMNFFTPYDMSLHYPESYGLVQERALIVADEKKIEVKEVVQNENVKNTEVEAKMKFDEKEESLEKLRSAVDALEEVKVLFEKASESGIGVLKVLKPEADQNYVFQLDSREKANLSSVLRELSIWEHKLYSEVKAEEEMRVRHEDLQKRMNKYDEKGSEEQKVNATQKAILSLAPKMKIAFDLVNRISIVTSRLRDEELWPCLKELINELHGMWMALLNCHKQQAKAIKEVADLHSFPSDGELSSAQVEAAMQLKMAFQILIISFCNWMGAQKGFVKSLNKWLQRCFQPELQAQSDTVKSTCPSSSAAPLISIICHKWFEGMKTIEDEKVVEAMQACVASVDQLLQRVSANIQQRVIIDGELLEKKVKMMEVKEKEMLKALDGWKKNVIKKLPPVEFGIILAREAPVNDTNNLQPGLKCTLESLETLAARFVHVYQDLLAIAENETQVVQDGN